MTKYLSYFLKIKMHNLCAFDFDENSSIFSKSINLKVKKIVYVTAMFLNIVNRSGLLLYYNLYIINIKIIFSKS